MKRNGFFITLEGIEGVGKTSNLEHMRDLLQASGATCVVTREPGGTALGESIREMLLSHADEQMDERTELLLMFAARAEHLQKVILPALKRGDIVLCDRFTEATYAYQGGGRGIDMEKIAAMEDWVQGELRPDLTIILDAPVDIGRARAGKRSAPDRIENEQDDFFSRVRAAYLDMAKHYPHRIAVVDADQPLESVKRAVHEVLIEYEVLR